MAVPRRRLVPLVAWLALLALAAGPAVGQAPTPSGSPAVNPICARTFALALSERDAADSNLGPSEGASTASPDGITTAYEGAWLDQAIRACSSLDDFRAAAAMYPRALEGTDVQVFVASRCWDTLADLAKYATCESFEAAIATPSPSPVPTATDDPPPRPTARSAKEGKPPPDIVGVPRNFRAKVPTVSKVVYFAVRGSSYEALHQSMRSQGKRHCENSDAIACLHWQAPSLVMTTRPGTGACRVVGLDHRAKSMTAYMPRWVGPKRAERYLVWWWRKAMPRVGWHEAQHARIFREHLSKMPKLAGLDCAKGKRLYRQWNRRHERAQARFDERDYPRGEANMAKWLGRALERYPR